MSAAVTVFIPTLNAGPELQHVIDSILAQVCSFKFEVLVIDSESDDGKTQEILKNAPIRWQTISRREFNHGETRNLAARLCDTEFIAYLSQDALPLGTNWLQGLMEPFANPKVIASYARQRPRPDAHPFQKLNLAQHMKEALQFEVRYPIEEHAWTQLSPVARVEKIRFDNVSSMIRRQSLLNSPFPESNFAEDLFWARRMLLSGHAIAFCPKAQVIHSHQVNRTEFYSRVRLVHQALRELCDFVPIANRRMQLRRFLGTWLRFHRACVKDDQSSLVQRILRASTAPWYAFLQMEAMYRGARDGHYDDPYGSP